MTRAQEVRKMRFLLAVAGLIIAFLIVLLVAKSCSGKKTGTVLNKDASTLAEALAPDYEVNLLTVNEYSRPGIALEQVDGIVVHYTANPGSTAQDNRDYFEGLKDSHTTRASSHFVIGLEGEVVQCIPTAEISYASNDRNTDTISIECCHPDDTGKFTDETYNSLVQTTAWLCAKFQLTGDDVIRHYDVTGKNCPLYFVEHEDAWKQFKQDVDDLLEKGAEAIQ